MSWAFDPVDWGEISMIAVGIKKILIGAGVLLLATLPANATNLLNTIFAPAQTFSSTGFLKVFSSGSFTQAFSATTTKTVMISFSAVCSVSGTGDQATTIKILIDN